MLDRSSDTESHRQKLREMNELSVSMEPGEAAHACPFCGARLLLTVEGNSYEVRCTKHPEHVLRVRGI